jgi:tetratricopeptide (TPR) repeat protein
MLGFAKVSGGSSTPEASAFFTRALDLARRLGDADTYWGAAGFWLWGLVTTQDEERLRLAEELAGQSRQGVSLGVLRWTLWFIVQTFLEFGQRQRAEEIMAEMKTLAERTGQPNLIITCMFNEAIMAIWDGRLEEAVAIRRRMLACGEELGIREFAAMWSTWVLPARVHLGDAGRALELNLQASRGRSPNVGGGITILFCLTHLGRYAEVTEALELWVVPRPGDEWGATSSDTVFLEGAVAAGHRQAAALLLRRQAPSGSRTSGMWLTTCTGRHLAAAAAFLGRLDEARKYYQEAIRVCTEIRFRPELALSRLQLAELLLEHYPNEKKEALEHLDFAIKEFQDMKMQPSLERALRHKEILKA